MSRFIALRGCLDDRQAAAPHSGYFLRPPRPIVSSVGTGGVADFNCGAPSALCIGYVLGAARLTVDPSDHPPQERKFQETERDFPRTAKLPLQRRHLQIP